MSREYGALQQEVARLTQEARGGRVSDSFVYFCKSIALTSPMDTDSL